MYKYSEQFKLAIVQRYFAGTVGYKQIAYAHPIPASTVKFWIKLHEAYGTDGRGF